MKMTFSAPLLSNYQTISRAVGQFMALNMGILDLGSDVLTSPTAGAGWKVLAFLEISCSLLLVFFLYRRGVDFHRRFEWRENKNITSFKDLGKVDDDGDGLLALDGQ